MQSDKLVYQTNFTEAAARIDVRRNPNCWHTERMNKDNVSIKTINSASKIHPGTIFILVIRSNVWSTMLNILPLTAS